MKFTIYISRWLLSFGILIGLAFPLVAQAQENRPVVVLSPGHGWWDPDSQKIDPGAVSGDLVEKDINLDVAQYAQDYLERCPVDVYLTRNGDDKDHTLSDVDEVVNGHDPTIGVSIHTNSGTGNPSGTEGWYTVGGYDDENSQQLAASLADQIASRLQISDRGAKPETANRHGGLYIHWWNAPSALVEIAFLQGDAELLRMQKNDFGRSIAQAILEYLDIDVHCADWSVPQGLLVSTYFPGDTKTNEINLQNDGLVVWKAADYSLINQGKEFGANSEYPLSQDNSVGEVATWKILAIAPSGPGIYRQEWKLFRDSDPVGKTVTVYIIVVPEEARQLKEDIDRRIEEIRQRGEEELEKLIDQLEQEIVDWVTRELPNLICPQPMLIGGFVVGAIFVSRKKLK